jgi:mRNA-degrading endonuclease toxin of MazEF toxin-antitoxin module
MPNTTTYRFGDVVLVPFPFTDQTEAKKRPAVIVSSDEYHQSRPHVILIAITGHLSGYPRIGEVLVLDWKEAGLIKTSTIKPILTTVEKNLIVRRLGQLRPRDVAALKGTLRRILG